MSVQERVFGLMHAHARSCTPLQSCCLAAGPGRGREQRSGAEAGSRGGEPRQRDKGGGVAEAGVKQRWGDKGRQKQRGEGDRGRGKGAEAGKKQKMDSTPHCSRVVPHPSTKRAQTSVFG